jgi:glycosyltransferase involved in cell wall biosynthesis
VSLPSELPALPLNGGEATTLRVAFFSDAFAERNGTGAYYHDLLPQLGERMRSVRIFQPANDGRRPLLSIPMPGDSGQRLVTPAARSIRRECDRMDPEVIVVVTPGLYGLLGVWEAHRRGIPLLAAFHTDFEELARMYWNPVARFFVNLVLRSANRIVCRASRCVLINNGRLRADVERLGARSVEVIGTPLAPEFLQRPLRPMSPCLERVCFAGRLAPEKNVDCVIAAARRVPDIEFVIAGDGPLRQTLERDAADCPNVRFTGWLKRSELIDLLDSASLLLLPSSFETFGSVALEAMARGRPALVTTQAGIHTWPDLQAGLFSIRAPGELTERLVELLRIDERQWRERATAARRAAEALNDRTLAHWQMLLERQVPRLAAASAVPTKSL